MADTYQPPANLKDFNRSANGQTLFRDWHRLMNRIVNSDIDQSPAFYNVLTPPSNDPPQSAAPEWTGLPRTIKRLVPNSIAAAARLVENAVRMGRPDPINGPNFTPPFHDAATGAVFAGPAYRPQDEYLEWVTRRDADGTITEVVFTCEGPEYWDNIARDRQLLLDLYKELVGDNSVVLEDLLFPRRVTWENPNARGVQTFEAGSYNPYNKWNIAGAVHLTQPANTLGAEITLAKEATLLYGNPDPVTADPDLICCAAYGGINRMSDPTIGSGVNTQVQLGNRVALRNPIGLYMKVGGLRTSAFSLPNGQPFTDAQACFEVIRPAPEDVTDMIVRARFRVPVGLTFQGRQLRVGDLKVEGEQVVTGGQVADTITMTLFAEALPGAPEQEGIACRFSPCPDSTRPDLIRPIPFGSVCPQGGVSSVDVNLGLTEAEVSGVFEESVVSSVAEAEDDGEPLPASRYAINRAGRVF